MKGCGTCGEIGEMIFVGFVNMETGKIETS